MTSALPILTLTGDTESPVGQAVAMTYGSRSQEPGKIVVAVSAFNLRGMRGRGFHTASGRLRWNTALLDVDGVGIGDLLGGNEGGRIGPGAREQLPDTLPFIVSRTDQTLVTGSGELILVRLTPRPGVTTGSTRIELDEIVANEGGPFPFLTRLLLSPYAPSDGNQIENAYGGTVTIRPGS